MQIDIATLKEADCFFSVDNVPRDPAMTAFRREARLRQSLWRDAQGLQKGSIKGKAAGGGPPRVPIGSRLTPGDACEGENFLSKRILVAAQERVAAPELHQTLNVDRLTGDLLSSMPMCFNLLGELTGDPKGVLSTAEWLGYEPRSRCATAAARFEWSPGRRCSEFTADRTAFDAAILIGDRRESRHVIGIETKYHEDARVEKVPGDNRLPRYKEITKKSGVFSDDWQDMLGTEVQQLWRDHLLVLSMVQSKKWASGKYLLVYPERNVSFARASEKYQGYLRDSSTFQAVTMEELLKTDLLHTSETAGRFGERYVW